jgi:TatD DNase family protein
MELLDIGVNLAHDSYDSDRGAVIARAFAADVAQLIVTGASLDSSDAALRLAHAHPQRLFATAGVHPHHAAELGKAQLPRLRALLTKPGIVAAGECGLDYFRDYAPRPTQREAFALQLELAVESGKPLFLHQRDAHADFIAALREHAGATKRGLLHGVAHCFTGGEAELEAYLEMGLHIGITGWICDERRGQQLQRLVRKIPTGRLLLETDGPYLLPRDLQPRPASRRNEPAYLAHIAATVARLRGETPAECAAHTTAAARQLFGIPPPPAR